MDQPLVSVIMPTLNSERTIRESLESLRRQIYDPIEVLVVDGGSTDRTREIALGYGCRIVENPRVQPECAKHEGILHAEGRYAMFLDSDEVLEDDRAIGRRVSAFEEHDGIFAVLSSGYTKPAGYSSVNDYINVFSDPFSYFMYGISSDSRYYIRSMEKRYRCERSRDAILVDLSSSPFSPLVDMCAGNAIDLSYLKERFSGDIGDVRVIPRLFQLMTGESGRTAIIPESGIRHYSSDSYAKYVRKIRWRVVTNLFYSDSVGVGYSNREYVQPLSFRLKKYLFVPFALSIVLPLVIAVREAVAKKNIVLLAHVPLTLYTGATIVYYLAMKYLGMKPKLNAYGK